MERKGWGSPDLARESGVDSSLIGRYLREEVEIGRRNAPRLAVALDIDPAHLLFGAPAGGAGARGGIDQVKAAS